MESEGNLGALLGPGQTVTDWGRMQRATVRNVARPKTETELQEIIRYAAKDKLKVSLRGAGHSAGGHSFCQGGIMIDMRELSRILELDREKRTVRVQSGATWEVLTKVLEPLGLAITTKQEFDIFTVGGSVAANVHGKSIDYGPLIESILSLRLVRADGEIVPVSREENAELFRAVIGGYGLFGVVADVTFKLVEERLVEKGEVVSLDAEALIASYIGRINKNRRNTPLCYGFLDTECSRGFYVTYSYLAERPKGDLGKYKRDEPNPIFFNAFVAAQRASKFIRRRAFDLMRAGSDKPEVTLRSRRLLLWDHAPAAFQKLLLQKYFVPIANFPAFIRKVGEIFKKYEDDLPLMTNHFRFVPGNGEAIMSFSKEDTICLIPCYLAKTEDARWLQKLEQGTNELLNACLQNGGRYYLTFDIIASKEQFQRAYPQGREFFALKRKYDSQEMFSSRFYEKYAG